MRRIVSVVLACLLSGLLLSGCAGGTGSSSGDILKDTAESVERFGGNSARSSSAVDFSSLQAFNPEICAWIYVPDTQINGPVLQSNESETYYSDHAADLTESAGGALFTQGRYNAKDFTDPVTIIYGQNHSGGVFSQLEQTYAEQGALDRYGEIIVYTPEDILRYQVFGSSAYSKSHILNSNNRFTEAGSVPAFLSELKHYHTMMRQFDESIMVSEDDRILILSTALSSDSDQRYLVLAILAEEAG